MENDPWMSKATALEAQLDIERRRNDRLRFVLTKIAAFYDTTASEYLRQSGSYSGFDEPSSVRLAREVLDEDKGRMA